MPGRSLVVAVATAGDKAIAGPLVASAVVFDAGAAEPRFTWSGPAGTRSCEIHKIDSAPAERRQQMSAWVRHAALGLSTVVCTPRQLNSAPPRSVKQEAIGRAVVRAVEHARFRDPGLTPGATILQVGGVYPVLRRYAGATAQVTYRDRDNRPWQVSAAYALARVYRDVLMAPAAAEFPQYEFLLNFGYASNAHRDALETYGPTHYHRMFSRLLREIGAP